ncbi:hypothetical protein SAMN05192539_10472 [Paraburkholderia diazotrophica]|uniref:Uncharacterized protein n=1 Tax=Paraburkholderia diazotrophica TaxID=667676 RepID=A0A1H7EHM2_9BURK|nr:hypothetical protein SAMN05192539_10472 [Paraburkholderia diazotrophica]
MRGTIISEYMTMWMRHFTLLRSTPITEKPYRGYQWKSVLRSHAISFGGIQRRYAVAWSAYSVDDGVTPLQVSRNGPT